MPVAATFDWTFDDGSRLGDLAALDTMVTVVDSSTFLGEIARGTSLAQRGLGAAAGDERSIADLLIDQVEFADVVLISNTVGPFAKAAERGWLTVWLNRDRVANLSETMPSAEIHSLLDLPEALDAIDEARAIIAGLMPSSEATIATALDGVTPA